MADRLSAQIERKIASLPDKPGVYLWKDTKGRVLYVGKAKRLRQRVRGYLHTDYSDSARTRMLRKLIADLDTIVAPSESQALLLENNLIKQYRPRFNIKLRDDKSYPRIAVTLGEEFPRVLVVRRVNLPGARYYGPYTDVTLLRRTLRIIRRIFTVRSCHYDLPEDAPERPCLDYHINRCLAPCVGYQSREDYRTMIDDVITFLEGKTVEVRARLRERMEQASQRLDFERARELRDALRWLEQLEQPQTMEFVGGGDVDVVGFARDGDDAVGVLLRVRKGKVIARDQRFFENLDDEPDEAILSAFVVRHYVPTEQRARRVVLPFQPADLEAATALLPDTRWSVPQRGARQRLVAFADQNARHLLESLKIESFETDERVEDPVYALGRDLGLTLVPRDFVCIDISTNQGRDTVGSLVWFEGGRPKKSEYRKYRIRGQREQEEQGERQGREVRQVSEGELAAERPQDIQQDDFAAVHEVVDRFLTRRLNEDKQLPDLIVIDGGKGQLSAAARALEAHGLDSLPLASLAKREEEIFVRGHGKSLRLPARSPSLKLLQRARDEAHRFAITYSRARRTARTVTSELLNIRGVGEKRRRLLVERFGSLAGVRLATPEEIAALPGFSTRLADRVLDHLQS